MNVNYKISTAPTAEPITLAQAKSQCLVESEYTEDDDFLKTAIIAAREYFERVTGKLLMPQTVKLALSRFPRGRKIDLGLFPIESITSIKYRDSDNAEVVLSAALYSFVDFITPPIIELDSAESWPVTYIRLDAVIIEMVAGYTTASLVPQSSKNAILMLVASLYANRETVTENGKASVMDKTYSNLFTSEKTLGRW